MTIIIVVLLFIVIAAGPVWYFLAHDHGAKEPAGALWMMLLLGLVGVVIAASLEAWLIPAHYLEPGTVASNKTFLRVAGLIALIEESCKFLPAALFLYPKRYFNEHTDGVIYFAMVGFGFGVPENILYALQFGGSVGWLRLALTPFFHAAVTAPIGYWLIKSKLDKKPLWAPLIALVCAIGLHTLYDFGLLSQLSGFTVVSLAIAVTATASPFVLYSLASSADRVSGLSAVGANNFCRHCGQANPEHTLYCTHCGQHA